MLAYVYKPTGSLFVFLSTIFYVNMDSASNSNVKQLKRKTTNLNIDMLKDLSKEELIHRILSLKGELEKNKNKLQTDTKILKPKNKQYDFTRVQMRPIALKVMYQGWNYQGFQIQTTTDNTIASHLLKALLKTCLIQSKDSSGFSCSGRTDMGVSSFGQVVTLNIRSKLNSTNQNDSDELPYVKMLNSNLPEGIRVIAWSPVPERYSARFDCLYRNYKYWFPKSGLNIEAMNTATQHLIGSHDFRNLCKMNVGNGVVNFIRNITHASISEDVKNSQFNDDGRHDMCVFHIRSQGFLWHQIRCIMSVLFMVGEGKESPDIILQLMDIDNCPRKPVYPMVIGEPLNLYETEFGTNMIWQYDEIEIGKLMKELYENWTLLAIKSTMLGEMIKDIAQDSKLGDKFKLGISHLVDGVHPDSHVSLMSRKTCASLENRIEHFVKKKKIEIFPDNKI